MIPVFGEIPGKKKAGNGQPKRVVKRPDRPQIPCMHCGLIFEYKVGFCKVCNRHIHEALYGDRKFDVCWDCRSGLSTPGEKWQRANRKWNGVIGIEAAYDKPEFYDGEQEISNMTIMPLWVNYESGNAH